MNLKNNIIIIATVFLTLYLSLGHVLPFYSNLHIAKIDCCEIPLSENTAENSDQNENSNCYDHSLFETEVFLHERKIATLDVPLNYRNINFIYIERFFSDHLNSPLPKPPMFS